VSGQLIAAIGALGAVGGFLSGLLGFGGGVLMFPLLYYVPPLLGLGRYDAQTVAAIVITQVFFSALVGGLAHLRGGQVRGPLVLNAGIASALGSFAGGLASSWVSERFLLVLFGLVTLSVLLMMFLSGRTDDQDKRDKTTLTVRSIPLICCSMATGMIIGFLGAGNFVFVPLLIYIFKVPTRIAIGSSLFIALMNSASGFVGKFVTGQIPPIALAVVLGAAFGALAGEKAHHRFSTYALRLVYGGMVLLITIRVWLTITALVA
jgi:uncharacterized protein